MPESIRILVLEDDPDMRRQLQAVLEDEGYDVAAAGNGTEALAHVRKKPFDLVVADIRMEGMSGLDVIEQVQSESPAVRSLVITGYASEEDSIRAIQLGVGDYIRKPFRLADFLASVARRVAERRQEIERIEKEQGVRRMALGALRALVGAQPFERPLRAGELASQLASELGESPETCEELELVALIETLRARGLGAMVEWAAANPRVARIADSVNEPWNKVNLETRIVAVAVAAAALEREAEEEPASLAVELSRQKPGQFDPGVLEGLDRLRSGAPAGITGMEARHRRGLLTFGQALEQAGDVPGARAAYEILVEQPSREAVAAWLGLGRTAPSAEARPPLQKGVELARSLGPATAGSACLEAGLILLEIKDPAHIGLFEEAVRALGEMGFAAGEAQARLALARAQNKTSDEDLSAPLQILLRAEHQREYAACSRWLLPFLLERQASSASPLVERALARMITDFPGELARQIDRLSSPARVLLAQMAQQLGGDGAELLLGKLKADPAAAAVAATATPAAQPAQPRMPSVRILSLGAFEVYRGEERVDEADWKTKKVKYLFAYLCAHKERFVSEDVLIEEFWPDDFERGRRSLYSATSSLRRCLRPSYWQGELDTILRREGRLQLNPDLPTWHDLDELEDCLAQVHRASGTDQEAALDKARRVAQLYRGPYLDGCYMDWALTIRTRLESQVSALLFQLARHCYTARRFSEALEYVHRALEVDPCHQEGHLLAMHCFLTANRPEEAVRQFERAQRILRTELAMEPSIELLEAHQRALLSLSSSSGPQWAYPK